MADADDDKQSHTLADHLLGQDFVHDHDGDADHDHDHFELGDEGPPELYCISQSSAIGASLPTDRFHDSSRVLTAGFMHGRTPDCSVAIRRCWLCA